jgi:hypothetical protein
MTNLEALREACAKVCETMSHGMDMPARRIACDDCAAAIRALDLTPFQPVGAGTSIAVSLAPAQPADSQREEAKATLRITEHLRDAANLGFIYITRN